MAGGGGEGTHGPSDKSEVYSKVSEVSSIEGKEDFYLSHTV